MVGSGILISPILQQGTIYCLTATVFGVLGASSINAYFPSGVWYDFYTWQVETDQGKATKTLPVSDNMPVNHSYYPSYF